jgi:elongation factor 1-beta
MGTMLLIYKIMPSSPDANLEEIEEKVKKAIEEKEGKKVSFTREPVAFGLNAIKVGFDLDEKNDLDPIQSSLEAIENISSVEVEDMRRAFG